MHMSAKFINDMGSALGLSLFELDGYGPSVARRCYENEKESAAVGYGFLLPMTRHIFGNCGAPHRLNMSRPLLKTPH